ncbi:MAG: PD-(D/E)XK nuclease family protein [Candidatus Saccharimonadales bacterium]|jgi:CRISPR/Cas system-associated exonuclease Cas4 (RecB family)
MADFHRFRSKPYQPGQTEPYKLSRSKIEDFMNCPRCFWLDQRLKISRPSTPPFQINKAVDELFKKEFDEYRRKKEAHPLMIEFGIEAIPFQHNDIDKWRQNMIGVQFLHQPTNLLVFGAIDDLWVNSAKEVLVVDYKATAKRSPISLDAPWQITYKRQVEIYQWLLRHNGLKVGKTSYFVYTNGRLDLDGFYDKVEFVTKIIPYVGDDSWVDETLVKIKKCLEQTALPTPAADCEYCQYVQSRTKLALQALGHKIL